MNTGLFENLDCGGASVERIKELSMKKIQSLPKRRHISAKVIAAAAIVAAFGITAAAVSGANSWGFADTSQLSAAEIEMLLEEVAAGRCTALVDKHGNVSYLCDGEVRFTLSAVEARLYEDELRAARKQAVRASTDKLDVDTMELFPSSVTEIAVDENGNFGNFMLSNGHTVLLCDSQGGCFELEEGNAVSILVTSSEECYVRFGLVQNGNMAEEVSLKAKKLNHSFTIPADGEYCFTLSYYSTDADNFTDGKLVQHQGDWIEQLAVPEGDSMDSFPVYRYNGEGWHIDLPVSGWNKVQVHEVFADDQWRWESEYQTGSSLTIDHFTSPMEVLWADARKQGYTPLDSEKYIWERSEYGITGQYYFREAADGGCWRVSIQWTDANITDDPYIAIEPDVLRLMAESFTADTE